MFPLIPRQVPSDIMVIGAGGTGGRLMPMLSQFLRSITNGISPNGWLFNPRIILIDDDTVEQKNLMRQNFIEADIGKPKASVLAQRYERAYGVTIRPLIQRITGGMSLKTISLALGAGSNNGNPLHRSINPSSLMVILCVDSVQARCDILNMLAKAGADPTSPVFIIDAGNENNFGQVKAFHLISQHTGSKTQDIASSRGVWKSPQYTIHEHPINVIPFPYMEYIHLQETPESDPNKPVTSCADYDQTLAINAGMATAIMGFVQNFYFIKPIRYHEIGISLNGDGYVKLNTYPILKDRSLDVSKYAHLKNSNPQILDAIGSMPYMDGATYLNSFLVENEKKVKALIPPAPPAPKLEPVEKPVANETAKVNVPKSSGEAAPIQVAPVQPREIPALQPIIR